MAIVVTEQVTSREWSNGSVLMRFDVGGSADDVAVESALLAAVGDTYNDLVREPDVVIQPVWVDEAAGDGLWECSVRYNKASRAQRQELQIGQTTIAYDTTGGTQHVTQSIATSGAYADGGTAPDYQGAIGVSDDDVAGTDIIVPVFHFTVTALYAAVDIPGPATIFALTGKVNDAMFAVTDSLTGKSIPLAAGECLFLGASAGEPDADGSQRFTYSFSGSPNRTDIVVGDITVAAKLGWEYLWVRYAPAKDPAAGRMVKVPIAAYVEKVYDLGDFSELGIGT